jgi:hypothetical protein
MGATMATHNENNGLGYQTVANRRTLSRDCRATVSVAQARRDATTPYGSSHRRSVAPSSRETFTITLRPEPGICGLIALRAALKRLLRDHGLRCTAVRISLPEDPLLLEDLPQRGVADEIVAHDEQ